MSRVLIIGAGGVGRVVIHKCAQLPEVFSDIWLASRTLSKCKQIAEEVGGGRIKTAQVDADKVPELVALIRHIQPRSIRSISWIAMRVTMAMPSPPTSIPKSISAK